MRCTIFGYGDFLNEIAELIHVNNGHIRRIVLNLPKEEHNSRKSLEDMLLRISYVNKPVVVDINNYLVDFDGLHVFGFSSPKKKELLNSLTPGLKWAILIHPSVNMPVYDSAFVGQGTIINAGVNIGTGARISNHVTINRGVTIGHDAKIGDFSVIQPGANVAGHVTIGEGTTVGIGANVIEDKKIGNNVMIAAGSIVIDDVPDNVMVAGIPAIIKKRYKP